MSENWANMAKIASDKLHLQYILDLDAGGVPHTEGTWTLNPVLYQAVPIDSILTQLDASVVPDTIATPIPPGGGSFTFDATVTNNSEFLIHFDGWLIAERSIGGEVELLLRPGLFLPSGLSVSRTLTISVPWFAPPGWYTTTLYLGDYGWNIWMDDSLVFQKLASEASANSSWTCSGWDEVVEPAANAPETHLLANVFPNPFNPTTVVSYQLSEVSNVNLAIYDVTGKVVAELVDGWRTAGTHEVTFDASDLPSGVYIYSLEAGDFTAIGKMVLMK
jgi:hypothetical protein